MSGPPGRISLFITLGIAAIDMLSCAFVSSILLFVMFLLPEQTTAGGATAAQNLLVFQWSFVSQNQVVLAIELEPPGEQPATIWSDDPQSLAKVCNRLSKATDVADPCQLYIPNSQNDLDRMLVIEQPKSGDWGAKVLSGDTATHGNGGDDKPVSFRLTVIGKEVLSIEVDNLDIGLPIDLSNPSVAPSHAALHVD